MITVLGSIHVDFVIRVKRFPHPGETILGHGFTILPGGKGANQAVGCGRLGLKTFMVGKIGRSFRAMLVDNFKSNNVDTSYIAFSDELETGVAVIYVNDETGENMIAVDPGADYALSREDVDRAEPALSASRVFLTQLEIPLGVVEYSLAKAGEYVDYVVLNPAPASSLRGEVLRHVDVITPNRSEASLLTGVRVTDVKSAVEAGRRLIEMGVEHVVVTMGSEGAVLVARDYALLFPAFRVSVVDTTGAGDAFNAGLAYGLATGLSLPESVKIGVAAAAIKVTKPGAQTGLPWKADLDVFAQRREFQEYEPVVVA
ncbi:ribokinase [Thermogladius sp.]|uniref:ribokinase n=1 Tax=Thermogladius sp. TaxID=2023064 RepID=UPI003D1214E3